MKQLTNLGRSLIFSLGLLIFVACASAVHRGVVAMKIDDSTAHVGLNKSEVSVGDHVELFSNQCHNIKVDGVCKKISKGHGLVTGVINNDYVSVKFDQGVTFKEGDFIEKHSH